jgi:hypothetical protein
MLWNVESDRYHNRNARNEGMTKIYLKNPTLQTVFEAKLK